MASAITPGLRAASRVASSPAVRSEVATMATKAARSTESVITSIVKRIVSEENQKPIELPSEMDHHAEFVVVEEAELEAMKDAEFERELDSVMQRDTSTHSKRQRSTN